VLLSTYNGARFVSDLLASVVAQVGVNVAVYVRDDGSTDETPSIILNHARRYPSTQITLGENLGVNASFFELLTSVGPADYYAICDQDDIWLPDKLVRAICMLEAAGESAYPRLYGSRVTLVDEKLQIVSASRPSRIAPGFANALVENVLPGCTMVLNRAARAAVVRRLPEKVRTYDWWLYQVLSGIGEISFDEESRILYRQHSTNTIGAATGPRLWRRRIGRFAQFGGVPFITDQATELLSTWGNDLSSEASTIVRGFVEGKRSLWSRVRYAARWDVYRSHALDDLVFRVLYLLDRI